MKLADEAPEFDRVPVGRRRLPMDCGRPAVRPPRLRGRSGRPRVRVNVLGNDISLAGFQVVISGRFWVFTEGIMKLRLRYLTRGNPNS